MELVEIKKNIEASSFKIIRSTVSLFLTTESTTQVTPQAPSPLTFFLKSRTAASSSSSRPALPSPPPQPPSAPVQSGLLWGSRARRQQGAPRGEQLRPGQKPQGQLSPPWTDRVQLACVCFTAGGGCSVHPRTAWHQTRAEWTHFYPSLPHQDAKPQRPEGDSAVNPPQTTPPPVCLHPGSICQTQTSWYCSKSLHESLFHWIKSSFRNIVIYWCSCLWNLQRLDVDRPNTNTSNSVVRESKTEKGPLPLGMPVLYQLYVILSLINKVRISEYADLSCQGDTAHVASLLPSSAHRTLQQHIRQPLSHNGGQINSNVFQALIFDRTKKDLYQHYLLNIYLILIQGYKL